MVAGNAGPVAASLGARDFECPTCGSLPSQPCMSLAQKPQDASGRRHDAPFELDLAHPKRMALRRASVILEAAGLTAHQLLSRG